jgi:hypothetical protein
MSSGAWRLASGRSPPVEIDRQLVIAAPLVHARLLLDGPEAILAWFPSVRRTLQDDDTVSITAGSHRRQELLRGHEQWLPAQAALIGEDPDRGVRGFLTLREILAEPGPHIATELRIHLDVLPRPGWHRRVRRLRRLLDAGVAHLAAELGP